MCFRLDLPAEAREEARSAANFVGRIRAVATPAEADSAARNAEKDERDEGQPEAGASLGICANVKAVGLRLREGEERNVDDECDEHQERGEER